MKYASEDLIKEHDGILFGMTILEKMAELVQDGSVHVENGDIEDMVNFLHLFADKCHHGKEEGMMFPSMEKAGVPTDEPIIGQLLIEHTEGRKHIAEMGASVESGHFNEDRFVKSARSYIGLMRPHIDKENTVLFPIGDDRIPMDEQKALLEQFEVFEEEVMGQGTHEKLHALLHRFKIKYLD